MMPRATMLDGPLPSSEESERTVLGAIILDNSLVVEAAQHLIPADFYSPLNRSVFAAMIELSDQGKTIDPILIGEELKKEGSFESSGGGAAITNLTFGMPHFSSIDEYLRTIRSKSDVRETIRSLEAIISLALRGKLDADQIREKMAEGSLSNIRARAESSWPVSFRSMAESFPQLRPPVIDGLIRKGEVVNVIAKTKVGKSWLAYYFLLCVATGTPLFGRFNCSSGRVLLVDNELHRETIAHRIPIVAKAMGLRPEQYQDQIDVISLRGHLRDINQLAPIFRRCAENQYQLIVLDALYRMLPVGIAENANEGLAQVYNRLDQYAASTGAPFMSIHHASKGGQAEKDVTDVGSGAGSQSRAADTHIVLRPHQGEGCVVLDAAMRSWPPIEPLALRWSFPLWENAAEMDPHALKGLNSWKEERRQAEEKKGMESVFQALVGNPDTVKGLTGRIGMGPARIQRLVGALVEGGRVDFEETKRRGQECKIYRVIGR